MAKHLLFLINLGLPNVGPDLLCPTTMREARKHDLFWSDARKKSGVVGKTRDKELNPGKLITI